MNPELIYKIEKDLIKKRIAWDTLFFKFPPNGEILFINGTSINFHEYEMLESPIKNPGKPYKKIYESDGSGSSRLRWIFWIHYELKRIRFYRNK